MPPGSENVHLLVKVRLRRACDDLPAANAEEGHSGLLQRAGVSSFREHDSSHAQSVLFTENEWHSAEREVQNAEHHRRPEIQEQHHKLGRQQDCG